MNPNLGKDEGHRTGGIFPQGRVLLVDDDISDLEYHHSLLRCLGQTVVTCPSYTKAMDFLERENFDLVLVSQGSSAFEGRPVLEHALQIKPRVPVLVLARSENMRCYCDAMQLGAIDYLRKPVLPSEMREAILVQIHGDEAALDDLPQDEVRAFG